MLTTVRKHTTQCRWPGQGFGGKQMRLVLDDAGELTPAGSSLRVQQVILWSAPFVAVILLVLFLAFPGFFPPMSPKMSAVEVQQFYVDHRAQVLFTMVGFNLCGILIVPFQMLIMAQMMRMKTQSHIFAFSYLTAVVAGATLFALSNIFFSVAAFRPDQDASLVQLLNDLAWITFVAPIGMTVGELVLVALAIFFDTVPHPVLPRWVAYYSLLTALAIAPAALAAVATEGPFAWNGAISFWLRNVSYAAFLITMFFVIRTALNRQAQEGGLIE
jgi:hypothetical protein